MDREKNDFERLKDEADIEQVINYLGIPVTRRGANNFILCPSPSHPDRHATNCFFKPGWNNVYCKACSKAFKAIDLIMWTQGCDYGTAADQLWELEGCPDWYKAEWKPNKPKRFSLSASEAKLIGMKNPGSVLIPVRHTAYKEYLGKAPDGYLYDYKLSGNEGYTLCKPVRLERQDLADDKTFKQLVAAKCRDTLEVLRAYEENSFPRQKEISMVRDLLKRATAA